MIEIHLDGKPVTKLEAARAVAVVGGEHVDIGEPDAAGWIQDGIALGARSALGEIRRPELGCGSFRADDPAEMRQQAEMITLAAEIAELAQMIAAEQVVEFTSDSRMDVIAPCLKPEAHACVPDGKRVECDRLEHHKPANAQQAGA